MTLSTLSTRPVYSAFIEDEQKAYGVWNNHVEMGLWADLTVVAPASSNTLSKMATGACDNLLTAVFLSAKCPVFVAPAMDLDMYANGATLDNLKTLEQRGVGIIDSDYGELASGLVGKGRMAEPEAIADHLEQYLRSTLPLFGKKVLINAGPTHEHLDPVRFLGNNSSGKMGAAMAAAARDLGANVHLVLGPTQASLDLKGIKVTRIISADDMLRSMVSDFPDSTLTVCCAAVSDYRPVSQAEHKIKKYDEGKSMTIFLEKTPDILSTLGSMKSDGNHLVGFALETRDGESYAKQKLIKKNASAIVLNTLGKEGVGFETDTNEVSVYTDTGKTFSFPLTSKIALGKSLLELFMNEFNLSNA